MIHHSGWLNARRVAMIAFALFMAFALGASISAGHADAKKKAKVTMKVKTNNQAALLVTKKVNLKIRATAPTTMRVRVKQGGKDNRFTSRRVRFNKPKSKRISIPMNQTGRRNLNTCGDKTVKVIAKYSKFKRSKKNKRAKAKKRLAKQESLCGPDSPAIVVPLGDDPENCDFLDTSVCLQPFANDYYTADDGSTSTGKRLDIAADATPANTDGTHIDPTDMNRADGFSPGNLITLKVPGLDTPAAFVKSNLVPVNDLQAYDDPDQAVMIIDAETGERHPIWAELDANPTAVDPVKNGPQGGIGRNPGNTEPVNLIIRPAANFEHGKRYIVALRDLKNAKNEAIESPPAFRTYRDEIVTNQDVVEARRDHMNSVIQTLVDKAGVDRSSLYMAWDFTVASSETTTDRALTIRDDAFERLGDSNLADREIAGNSPGYSIQSATDPGGSTLIEVEGTLEDVPCYINSPNCDTGGVFEFDGNGDLTWNAASTTDVPFRCEVPRSVVDLNPGSVTSTQTGTYGHGLLGNLSQVGAQERVGYDGNTTWCAVDWAGFSDKDFPSVIQALGDMSNFPKMVDRMQQGFVNFLYLQRLLIHPNGLSQAPELQIDPDGGGPAPAESAIDTSMGTNTRGQYMGISQGGIMGGSLTALSPDADYGVLGVPGMNYSTLLRRSVDSDEYFKLPGLGLYANYPDESERPLLLSLVQLLWDRGEANGYAHHMTSDPLPNTPPHEVLMRLAFSDHQVANLTAEVQARTIGAKVYYPALQPERHWEEDPFMGIEKASTFPWQDGSMMIYYDSGLINFDGTREQGVNRPPNANVPPRPRWGYGDDPHSLPRRAESGIRHAVTFLNGPALNGGNTRGTIESCAVTGAGDYFEGQPRAPLTPLPNPAPGDERCYSNGWNGLEGFVP